MSLKEEFQQRVYVKIHRINSEVVAAACDENLLGVTIVNPETKARIYIDPVFYRGELLSVRDAIEILKTSTQANLVGKNIVDAAVKAGLIDPTAVLVVNDVKIAIYVRY